MAKTRAIGARSKDTTASEYSNNLDEAIRCYCTRNKRGAIDPANEAVALNPHSIHAMVWRAIILNAQHPHREADAVEMVEKALFYETCAERTKTAEDYIGLTLLYSTNKLTNLRIVQQPEKAGFYAKEARKLDSSLTDKYLSSRPELFVSDVIDAGRAAPVLLKSLNI